VLLNAAIAPILAHAATRADDGYCEHHDRYIRAAAQCATFTPATADKFPGLGACLAEAQTAGEEI
jgi:hypothetical protein